MTIGTPATPDRPNHRVRSRLLAASWSTGLFVIGGAIDAMGVINIPGATLFSNPGGAHLSDSGVGWFLLALAAWASVYFRHRAPLAPLLAGGVLLLVGTSYLLFLIGVCEVARTRPQHRRFVNVLAVAGVSLYISLQLFGPWGGALEYLFTASQTVPRESLAENLASIIIALASLTLTFLLIAYTRGREDITAATRRTDDEKHRADSLNDQLVRQEERNRIARDMHDALASSLARVSMQAGALEARAEQADPELASRSRTVQDLVRAAMGDLRAMLGDLRGSSQREYTPGAPVSMRSLGGLLDELRRSGVSLDSYVMVDSTDHMSPALDSAVFRIVQESLTNAVKHAPGAVVSLHLEASAASGVRVRVQNPLAPGGPSIPGSGHGLVGIRERADTLGGKAWIGSHDGSFIVDVTLPWVERD